jgi:hypothetical protein
MPGSDNESDSGPGLSVKERDAVLWENNFFRRFAGIQSLKWSDTLAQRALRVANRIRTLVEGQRGGQNNSKHIPGENTYHYAAGCYTFEEIIRLWGRYRHSIDPSTGLASNGRDVSRYKEMISSDSTEVGAAKIYSRGFDYFVCVYGPRDDSDDEADN